MIGWNGAEAVQRFSFGNMGGTRSVREEVFSYGKREIERYLEKEIDWILRKIVRFVRKGACYKMNKRQLVDSMSAKSGLTTRQSRKKP